MAEIDINIKKSTVILATAGKYCEDDIKLLVGLQEKTVTADTVSKTITPDAEYAGLSKITVNPTPSTSKTVTPSTAEQTVNPDTGKLISSVTVSAIPTETKTVTAGTSATTVSATAGKYMTSVTINPTPSETKTATANGTVTPNSGKLLSSVTVNVPPYAQDVATAAQMNANLVAANVGHVYRFTGTTDNTYTHGDIYIVEG